MSIVQLSCSIGARGRPWSLREKWAGLIAAGHLAPRSRSAVRKPRLRSVPLPIARRLSGSAGLGHARHAPSLLTSTARIAQNAVVAPRRSAAFSAVACGLPQRDRCARGPAATTRARRPGTGRQLPASLPTRGSGIDREPSLRACRLQRAAGRRAKRGIRADFGVRDPCRAEHPRRGLRVHQSAGTAV